MYCIVLATLKRKTKFRHRSAQPALQFASMSHTPGDKQSLCVEPATTEQPSLAIKLQLFPEGLRVPPPHVMGLSTLSLAKGSSQRFSDS